MNTVPQVMVSSTFFDLKQVRADLAHFLESQLGYKPLVSEWSSFPIDPDVNTIENCRRRVEREADILVLIIGGRYGSVDSTSSKSVTNIEYLAARAKGLPVYTFVERKILAVLPVWRMNKEGNFSSVVDDVRVFNFIEEIRDLHKAWMCEFDFSAEIIEALRVQFAYLALQGAAFAQKFRDGREYSLLRELHGAPLRVALEKPPGWEYRLFAESLIQGIEAHRVLKEQMRLGVTYGPHERVTLESFGAWSGVRMAELERMVAALSTLLNNELNKAMGLPGQPGDAEFLVFIARSVASLYQEAIEWGLRVRRVVPEEDLAPLVRIMENFADDILEKAESFGPLLLREVDFLDEISRQGGPVPERFITLRPIIPGIDQFTKIAGEISEKLKTKLG